MDLLAAIDRLRATRAVLLKSADPAARAFGADLARYEAEFPVGGERLDEVLGLVPPPGGRSWAEIERLAERDRLIVEIAETHFAEVEPAQAAKAMATEWNRYLRSAHAADRRRGHSLAEPGTLRAMLYAAIVLGGLPGERRLANVLRKRCG